MERIYGYARNLSTGAPVANATVTVYNAGSLTLSGIYGDNIGTPKANPFLTDANGYFFFYAANGRYDVHFSGAVPTPYTLGDILAHEIFTLNTLTESIQFLETRVGGTDFTIDSVGNTHTFSLPNASPTARGLVSTGAQTFAGAKTFSTPIAVTSGGTGLGGVPTNGQLLIGNGSGFTLNTLTGTANQVTVTNAAGNITLSLPQPIHTAATPTFATVNLTDLSGGVFGLVGVATVEGTLAVRPALTNGQLYIGRTGNWPLGATLTAGTGITITNGSGSITISAPNVLSTLNGLTGATQTFATGTAGADFSISSVGTTHTFNIPDASGGGRGFVSTGTQTFAGAKTFSGAVTFSNTVSCASTITNAGANGSLWERGYNSELLTIAAAASTDTSANLLPADAIIEAVVVRVVTAIPTAATFTVGDATIGGRFATGVAVAAGTTAVGLVHVDQTGTSGPRQTSAAKVRITPNLTPGAATGQVRIVVFYRRFVAPTS